MWPTRASTVAEVETKLAAYSATKRPLPGIASAQARKTLALQMVASLRRLDHTRILRARDVSAERTDPNSLLFDPEKAAIWLSRAGNLDEAVWLTFLATHVGKRRFDGWRRLRDIYSGLGTTTWTWSKVSADPTAFRDWLRNNRHAIGGGFGNHRKYESLDADSTQGTGAVVQSYLDWVGPSKSHATRFAELTQQAGNEPTAIFDRFFRSFDVARFGRLGRFDFLALIGRLGLAGIEPGSAYLNGATGPLKGAKLLFGGSTTALMSVNDLDAWTIELNQVLQVGMQVMEDALCNWQKSPGNFVHFKG